MDGPIPTIWGPIHAEDRPMHRPCPFRGCDKLVDPSKFGCAAHWRTLNPSQKKRIYTAFQQWQNGDISGTELRAEQQAVLAEVQGVRR